jgi:nitroreductase
MSPDAKTPREVPAIRDPASVEEAITSRRSIRAFLPDTIPRDTVERLLAIASRSPSGSNIQPWRVRVLAGEPRRRLAHAIVEALERDGNDAFKRDYDYYPVRWREPFLSRRRKIGWDMYSLIGVTRGDFEGTEKHRRRNFDFFGAPVGMIFTLDEDLEIGSWIDLGMFMDAVMVAARAQGLHTCPQAAFAEYHGVIRRTLAIPEREMIICGMALGYADEAHPINRLVTGRAPVEEFATFDGFD